MHEVRFCSGSVFATGDAIAMSLLRHVQALSTSRRSAIVTVPSVGRSGGLGHVTLMVNEVSQISAERLEDDGPELEDDAFVSRLDAETYELSTSSVWLGEDDPAVA